MLRTLSKIGLVVTALTPSLALAAAQPQNFAQLIGIFTDILLLIVPIVFALALLTFFWGLARFIFFTAGNEEAHAEAKNIMIWGIIALFVMLSLWGFVRILHETIFGVSEVGRFEPPTSPTHFDNTNLLRNF